MALTQTHNTHPHMLVCVLSALGVVGVRGCSNFMMENNYRLSVRTMDLGPIDGLSFGIMSGPQGATLVGKPDTRAKFGSLHFIGILDGVKAVGMATGGINDVGLTCDVQTLIGTKYPEATGGPTDIGASYLCEWAMAMCTTAEEFKIAISNKTLNVHGDALTNDDHPQHFVVRDVEGKSVVVEFINGEAKVYDDFNDAGKTGWGVMTNEPQFDWHVQNVAHYHWKQSLARPATEPPGSYYPDARFLRASLVKSAMPEPSNYREAMMQAIHALNTITVPMGEQQGTDSGEGEGLGDHTNFGVIYDHKNATMYFRTTTNQNMQRIRVADVDVSKSGKPAFMPVDTALPWFVDAAKSMSPA